jgi:hypothetical protein
MAEAEADLVHKRGTSVARAVQFSILGGEFDDGGEVERGAVAGILDVVGA